MARISPKTPEYGGGVHVWLEKDSEASHFVVRETTDVNLGLLFGRLKNAFVERLEINFVQSDDICFLRHLSKHGAELLCRANLLDPETSFGSGTFPYGFVDVIAERLKPQTLRIAIFEALRTSEATLFDHGSMRGVLSHVHFDVCGKAWAAHCVIPGLLNVDTLETCAIRTYEDAMPWVVRFVDMFKTTNRGAKSVRTMAVSRSRSDDETAPATGALNPLGMPKRRDVPAPRSEFARVFCRPPPSTKKTFTESAAELFVFPNEELGKRLDVYKWSAEQTSTPSSMFRLRIDTTSIFCK